MIQPQSIHPAKADEQCKSCSTGIIKFIWFLLESHWRVQGRCNVCKAETWRVN